MSIFRRRKKRKKPSSSEKLPPLLPSWIVLRNFSKRCWWPQRPRCSLELVDEYSVLQFPRVCCWVLAYQKSRLENILMVRQSCGVEVKYIIWTCSWVGRDWRWNQSLSCLSRGLYDLFTGEGDLWEGYYCGLPTKRDGNAIGRRYWIPSVKNWNP